MRANRREKSGKRGLGSLRRCAALNATRLALSCALPSDHAGDHEWVEAGAAREKGSQQVLAAKDATIKALADALSGGYAALTQPKTHPADIDVARSIIAGGLRLAGRLK